MAPDSNSTDMDNVDVSDVVSTAEVEQQLPQMDQPKQETVAPQVVIPQQQERRLEDVRRVRDEAGSMRQEICQLRLRLEEVEEESKFHAAKANELQELLMNSNSSSGNSGIDDTILKQSDDLARKACQIESLDKKITDLKTEKALLEIERDDAKKEALELSKLVRSLQRAEEDADDESEDSEEIVLTSETALDLTLGNLKDHIEMLEDGLQASSTLNKDQKTSIITLETDIKAQQAQIGMLEELFRELNAADRIVNVQNKKKEATAAASSDDDSKKEPDDEASRPSSPSAFALPSMASLSEARERNSQRLGNVFQNIKKASLAGMEVIHKERQPEIPVAAVAAAQAAAILLGKDESSKASEINSKPKKTKKKGNKAMKKVKIRFKKAGLEGTYTGPLVDKKPHGVGTIRFTNGNTYLGEMTRGKMSGSGTLYTKNNGVFRGLFENNQFVGETPQENTDENSSSNSKISNEPNPAAPESSDMELDKPCDATAATVEMEQEAKSNATAALELDAFSPSIILDQGEAEGIDDSISMMMNLDGMELKTELAEIQKSTEREENESFLKEFSGSEHSSITRGELDDSLSSHNEPEAEVHEVF